MRLVVQVSQSRGPSDEAEVRTIRLISAQPVWIGHASFVVANPSSGRVDVWLWRVDPS